MPSEGVEDVGDAVGGRSRRRRGRGRGLGLGREVVGGRVAVGVGVVSEKDAGGQPARVVLVALNGGVELGSIAVRIG